MEIFASTKHKVVRMPQQLLRWVTNSDFHFIFFVSDFIGRRSNRMNPHKDNSCSSHTRPVLILMLIIVPANNGIRGKVWKFPRCELELSWNSKLIFPCLIVFHLPKPAWPHRNSLSPRELRKKEALKFKTSTEPIEDIVEVGESYCFSLIHFSLAITNNFLASAPTSSALARLLAMLSLWSFSSFSTFDSRRLPSIFAVISFTVTNYRFMDIFFFLYDLTWVVLFM